VRIRKPLADQDLPFLAEWDIDANSPVSPSEVGLADKRKFVWQGACGHNWSASIPSRLEGNGCAVCDGKQINIGVNDLGTTHPKIASEWDRILNQPLNPSEVSKGSGKKVWWTCGKGHSYQATVSNRTSGFGCPYCSGRLFVAGVEDLETLYPEVAKQWSHKNPIPASGVSGVSGKPYIWECASGHEWRTTVNSRTRQGTGCPTCWGRVRVEGENDAATLHPELLARYDAGKNRNSLSSYGPGSGALLWWLCPRGHSYRSTIPSQIIGSECNICRNRVFVQGVNDLATIHPKLAREFDEIKNGISASNIKAVSTLSVWWKCDLGHEFRVSPNNRISRNTMCPFCANVKVLEGFNDLRTKYPELMTEWHPTKNPLLDPSKIGANNSKAWWLGSCGHEWQAAISSRTGQGVGCPYCSGTRVLTGFNDLATTNPQIALEWHSSKNAPLTPSLVLPGTARKVWWICSDSHTWKASIGHRTQSSPRGCPTCAKSGFNSAELGYLYLLKREGEQMQQFGISNKPEARLKTHQRNGWVVLDVIGPADGMWIRETETALKGFFRHLDLLLPRDFADRFDGYTESWFADTVKYDSIPNMLEGLREWEWSQK